MPALPSSPWGLTAALVFAFAVAPCPLQATSCAQILCGFDLVSAALMPGKMFLMWLCHPPGALVLVSRSWAVPVLGLCLRTLQQGCGGMQADGALCPSGTAAREPHACCWPWLYARVFLQEDESCVSSISQGMGEGFSAL